MRAGVPTMRLTAGSRRMVRAGVPTMRLTAVRRHMVRAAVPTIRHTLNDRTGMAVGVAFRRSRVRASLDAASLAICSPHLHLAVRGDQWIYCSV